jgi:pimeloyl-ACP methyl ester carboxylesterase
MDSKFMSWRGHQVHYTESGEGRPLMLINGLGCNTDMWIPLLSHFPGHRIVAFDAPGTGQSSVSMTPVSVPLLSDLVAAVLDECGHEQADVIGYSYGGAIAQQLAYDHPSRGRRLVLAATTCGVGSVPGHAGAIAVLATPLRYYSSSYWDRTAASAYGGVTARDSATRRRMMNTRRAHPPSWHGYAMQLLGGAPWSSWSFLSQIKHETLVICGDDDPLVPVENAKMLAKRIPHARLEIVEDGGHLMLWDEVDKLGERIGEFINAEPGANKRARVSAAEARVTAEEAVPIGAVAQPLRRTKRAAAPRRAPD